MQEIAQRTAQSHSPGESFDGDPPAFAPGLRSRRRGAQAALAGIVLLGLAAVLPPLVNVNRYQRRIASSIAQSLGRPVHMDAVTMNLLPVPGFTLSNFVVAEDPSFGSEPVVRANTVRANLRLRSLWHRRVEFSRIVLQEPSVNLVHRPDGQWNIESILLSASRIPVDPTDQVAASAEGIQRFPYIEATGARVNFKEGLEKRPVSLIDSEFALWLSQPEVWKLRLSAHPSRTNSAAADAGVLRVQGTLGKAPRLGDVPLDLQADWSGAPLGAASSIFFGLDAGLRGDLTVHARATGIVSSSSTSTHLEIRGLRRADFVPAHSLDVDLDCNASAHLLVRRLDDIQCASISPAGAGVTVAGIVPDVSNWRSIQIEGEWQAVPASLFLDVFRVASRRSTAALQVSGTSDGRVLCCAAPSLDFTWSNLLVSAGDGTPLIEQAAGPQGNLASGIFTLGQIPLNLGAPQPAVLAVQADASHVAIRLTGTALRSRLVTLAEAFPQVGEGLAAVPSPPSPVKGPETPLRLDLVAVRPWGESLSWARASTPVSPTRPPRR